MNTFFPASLLRSSVRYFSRHPWQLTLSIIGIAIGVAIVVSIDLANAAASAAFQRSSETVSGKATHHIVGGLQGFNDSIYASLRVQSAIQPIAPIVEGNVVVVDSSTKNFTNTKRCVLRVLGVDVFAEHSFRNFLQQGGNDRGFELAPFFTVKNAIILSSNTAAMLGKKEGDSVRVERSGKRFIVRIVGIIEPRDESSSRALSNLILCDISTAQDLLEMRGLLSRIDLILDSQNEKNLQKKITQRLPAGLEIMRSLARPQRIEDMTKAFELNLTALSLLALIVGIFIIYNTMTFSIIQRRQYVGMLRTMGITRKQVFILILVEASIIGACGTALGLALGIVLGSGLVQLVAQTINDLYFTVSITGLEISLFSLLKGILLGVLGVMLAAILPAREATLTPPRMALNRSQVEERINTRLPMYSFLGVVCVSIGCVFLMLPTTSIYAGYAGLLPIILGFGLLVPLVTVIIVRIVQPIFKKTNGFIGSMAARGVVSTLSRTGIAIASLMVAVSATIGVGVMVSSFRQTLIEWLSYTLTADIYISPPNLIARRGEAVVDSIAEKIIITHPAVQEWTSFRTLLAEGIFPINNPKSAQNLREKRIVQILTTHLTPSTAKRFHFKQVDESTVWRRFRDGEAIISETFSNKNSVQVGDSVELATDTGLKMFRVCGVYFEYASDIGIITLERETFNKFWNDRRNSGISIFLKSNMNSDSVIQSLRESTMERQELLIRSNRSLLAQSLEVFDRTFAITDVLRLLTIFVAFVGVFSALMALQFEKAREFGVLRANGVTPRQVWYLTVLQTSLIGFIAGFLAIPVGIILALVLIFVINQRSFGWTLQLFLSPEILLQALILSVAAAVLAGLYPAWKASRTTPAIALREE